MDITRATAEAVTEAIGAAGETLSSMSEKTGLAYTTLQNKTKGMRPFTVKELGVIGSVVGKKVHDLIPEQDAA